jgi:hypothetical protein
MLKPFSGLCFLSIGAALCLPALTRAQQSAPLSAVPAHIIPLNTENWNFPPGAVVSTDTPAIGSVRPAGAAMKITNGNAGRSLPKNTDFQKGLSTSTSEPSVRILRLLFYRQDALETEFLFRTAWASGRRFMGVQYLRL